MHPSNREESADAPIQYYRELPSRGMGEFFRLCLRKIFLTPLWESAHKIATLIICVIGAAAYLGPRLWPVLPHVEDWVILTTVIAGLLLFRCITAPYAVYKDVTAERDNLRSEALARGYYGKIAGPK